MLSLLRLYMRGGSAVSRLIAAAALALGVWPHAAVAQVPTGRIYVLHSQASHGCPPLDWHVVADAKDHPCRGWCGSKTCTLSINDSSELTRGICLEALVHRDWT